MQGTPGTITSVGIDIGTTTTQMVFSRLTMSNTAGPTQVPRYAITGREIIYASPVAFTPKKLENGELILDERGLENLVLSWYADAGMSKEAVTSGAVIVTGESLKKSNARHSVFTLSASLGDFVAATAGPRLESVIAGRGSGAAGHSARERCRVLNIDIGGGTSNYAVFVNGQIVDASCLNLGGRLVETDGRGTVTAIHPPVIPVLEDIFGQVPPAPGPDHLARLTDRMAELIFDQALGIAGPTARRLLQTESLRPGHAYDAVFISGGVGACCQDPPENPFIFGDIGPLLANSLLQNPGIRSMPLKTPDKTVLATVIGAGAWSLTLSGSTVRVDADALPMRNVPAVSVPVSWPLGTEGPDTGGPDTDGPEGPDTDGPDGPDTDGPGGLCDVIKARLALFDIDAERQPFALSFQDVPAKYRAVRYLAEGIGQLYAALPRRPYPLIVALRADMGKALGIELGIAAPGRDLVIVDEVALNDGDYLDLGKPLHDGGTVPLVIKSLAFSANGG